MSDVDYDWPQSPVYSSTYSCQCSKKFPSKWYTKKSHKAPRQGQDAGSIPGICSHVYSNIRHKLNIFQILVDKCRTWQHKASSDQLVRTRQVLHSCVLRELALYLIPGYSVPGGQWQVSADLRRHRKVFCNLSASPQARACASRVNQLQEKVNLPG